MSSQNHTLMLRRLTQRIRDLTPRRRTTLCILTLAVVAIAQHAYILRNPLLWDSKTVVLNDPSVRSLAAIPGYFAESTLPGAADAQLSYYRPIVKVVYAIGYACFGESAAGYHAISIFFNTLVVIAFFILVRALTGSGGVAVWASLVWTVNPARSEAVHWFYGLSNILVGLTATLALWAHHRRKLWLALILSAAALLCRETAVVMVALVAVYELAFREDDGRRRLGRVGAYAVVTVIYLAARHRLLGGSPSFTDLGPMAWLNTSAVLMQRLLRISVWPDGAVAIYPKEVFADVSLEVVLSYLVMAGVIATTVVLWRRQRRWGFWSFWWLLWIAPWFNIGQFGDYLLTEKATYLASGGLAVGLAALLHRRRWGQVALALIIAGHFGVTSWRATFWRDPTVFFSAAVDSAPDHAPVRFALGMHYVGLREYAKAREQLEHAVFLVPNHSHAQNNLGNCRFMLGDRAGARESWQRAYSIDPTNAEAAHNLGSLAYAAGDFANALEYYLSYLAHSESPSPVVRERVEALQRMLGR